MNQLQTDNVIAGYRKATDAQQDVIREMREKMRHMVRLDDPVVAGLVAHVKHVIIWNHIDKESARKALSAYEARVKEVGK